MSYLKLKPWRKWVQRSKAQISQWESYPRKVVEAEGPILPKSSDLSNKFRSLKLSLQAKRRNSKVRRVPTTLYKTNISKPK